MNSSQNVTRERQCFYCVPIPAETTWAKKISFYLTVHIRSNKTMVPVSYVERIGLEKNIFWKFFCLTFFLTIHKLIQKHLAPPIVNLGQQMQKLQAVLSEVWMSCKIKVKPRAT